MGIRNKIYSLVNWPGAIVEHAHFLIATVASRSESSFDSRVTIIPAIPHVEMLSWLRKGNTNYLRKMNSRINYHNYHIYKKNLIRLP